MKKLIPFLKIGLILGIFLVGTYFRYRLLDEAGGDLTIFRRTVTDWISGISPYDNTVASFIDANDIDHGYAYFPTMLYLYTPLYKLHQSTGIPLQRVWKAPLFLAEIGVAIMILKALYKKDFWACLAGVTMWWLNPFLIARNSYVYTEPYGILFILLAFYFLEKNDYLAGIFYAVSFSFKAFPVVLLPLFLIKSKSWWKFLVGSFAYAFLMSVPFMGNVHRFITYIKGSLLVHGSRDPQGRPILFFIKNYTRLPIYSLSLAVVYKYVSIFLAWGSTIYLIIKKKVVDKYVLSVISFAIFYLFTPVLTRTYMLWFIPVYIIGMHKVFESKNRYLFYVSLALFYIFYAWYLFIWTKGIIITNGTISL